MFDFSEQSRDLQARLQAFMDDYIYPNEHTFAEQMAAARWPDQTARLAAMFAAKPRDHWAGLFEGSDACAAPVLSPAEAASDPHLAARGVWSDAQGLRQPAPAPRFDGAAAVPGPVPARGAHGPELRANLVRRGLI